MKRIRMWCVTIRVKRNDKHRGRRLYSALLEFMMDAGISGATVTSALDGFGRRGRSTLRIEGVSVNYPLVIEVVYEKSRLEPPLAQLKRMVGDNGLITIHDVDVV